MNSMSGWFLMSLAQAIRVVGKEQWGQSNKPWRNGCGITTYQPVLWLDKSGATTWSEVHLRSGWFRAGGQQGQPYALSMTLGLYVCSASWSLIMSLSRPRDLQMLVKPLRSST